MIHKLLNHPIYAILILFTFWRVVLLSIGFFAYSNVSLGNTDKYLGGGSINYGISPGFFSWANFDGEHYLSISIHGYKYLEQAFFPVYPMLISFFANPISSDLLSAAIFSILIGLLISNITFFFSLIFLWKLIRIDYSQKIAYLTLILILLFPTSFYFGALYNESLYLLFSVLSFYFIRKGMLVKASILGGIASATRIFGLILFPSFILEAMKQKIPYSKIAWLILIPTGLGLYMFYQYFSVGDPLAFYRLQKLVGEQHQSGLTLLPQVYYRYIKMILTVDIQNPIYQTILLEFMVGIIFFALPIYGYFKKMRLSYIVYAMLAFLMPSIQGSFSSVPRYVIIIFPAFIAAALWLNNKSKFSILTILLASLTLLLIETSLFLRGYWVA